MAIQQTTCSSANVRTAGTNDCNPKVLGYAVPSRDVTQYHSQVTLFALFSASDVNPCPCPCKSSPCPCPDPYRLGPCPCPCRSSPWQVLFVNSEFKDSIVLNVIFLFSVMGFTVICCEFSLCVHCCCLIAIVGLAATCSKLLKVKSLSFSSRTP